MNTYLEKNIIELLNQEQRTVNCQSPNLKYNSDESRYERDDSIFDGIYEGPSINCVIISKPEYLEYFLKMGVDPNIYDNHKFTPLHIACIKQPSVIPMLLKAGANINAKESYGLTPLHFAIKHQPSVVELLLKYGASANVKTNFGRNSLYFAIKHRPKLINILLKNGAKINVKDCRGKSPLHVAVQYCPIIVEKLINSGSEINSLDDRKRNALHYAIKYNFNVVEILLKKGIEVDMYDNEKNTALHSAVMKQPNIVKFLLQHGANVELQNIYGETPLHLAARYNPCLIKLLVECGANVNSKTFISETPLYYVFGINFDNTKYKMSDLERRFQYILYLLKNGSEPNSVKFSYKNKNIDEHNSTIYIFDKRTDLTRYPYNKSTIMKKSLCRDEHEYEITQLAFLFYSYGLNKFPIFDIYSKDKIYLKVKIELDILNELVGLGADREIIQFLYGIPTNHKIYNMFNDKEYYKKYVERFCI